MTRSDLLPRDEHDAALVACVRPPAWQNPIARGPYDLVVIGGGTAGLVSAAGTAGLGGRVALIERHMLGGDCLNYGCVPSKALLRAARAAYDLAGADAFGARAARVAPSREADFAAAMARMRRLRAQISRHDSAQRFTELGVDVYFGDARFSGPQAIEVAGQQLRFKRAILATGSRPRVPDIPGLVDGTFLTNETLFGLVELPRRLIVLGGGPIGCEMAQAFARLGSKVTLVQRGPRLLPRDEPEVAEQISRQFKSEGIQVLLGAKAVLVERDGERSRVVVESGGERQSIEGEALLVATGRAANVGGLQLEQAGIELDGEGLRVNDFLQTTSARVYAAGDVAGSYHFTHAADAMARIAIQNAFFALGPFGRRRLSKLVVPWTTYTDPEVAHVGLTSDAARNQGLAIDTYRESLSRVDRAVLDGEDDGFAIIHCRRGTPRVVGCTIVARHAGEMIGEVSLLMTAGLTLSTLARTIHCYPTQVEVLKRLADQYQKSRLTPGVARLLRSVIAWRR